MTAVLIALADVGPAVQLEEQLVQRKMMLARVKALVDRAHDRVTALLSENRERLDSLAERLLEKETVDQDEAYEAAGLEPPRSTRMPELTPG